MRELTPRTWAEIETEKLGRTHQYFSEPAITLAFMQEYGRTLKIVRAEIGRVKIDKYSLDAHTKGHVLEALNNVLAGLQKGRK